MNVRWYFVKETELARRYCFIPLSKNPGLDVLHNINYAWIPRSVCSSVLKWPAEPGERPLHELKVEDWFLAKNLPHLL